MMKLKGKFLGTAACLGCAAALIALSIIGRNDPAIQTGSVDTDEDRPMIILDAGHGG